MYSPRLHAGHRHLKVLFIFGYTDKDTYHHDVLGEEHFLQKLFTEVDLARKTRETLEGERPC